MFARFIGRRPPPRLPKLVRHEGPAITVSERAKLRKQHAVEALRHYRKVASSTGKA